MTTFNKKATSTKEQLELLIRRGMNVSDRGRALHFLTHINYYRLRAYWQPFETPATNNHTCAKSTDFDTVLAIYEFDRELRMLLIDAIERVEISLRARFANTLSIRYGPFVHRNRHHLANPDNWRQLNEQLIRQYAQSHETFAKHYRIKYKQLPTPPLWVMCELLTLGQLSRWLKNLRTPKDRQNIVNSYGLDEEVFVTFVQHLTIVRNHCAHHERLWNRNLHVKIQIPKRKPPDLLAQFNQNEHGSIYNTLTMLSYLMSIISPESSWRKRLKDLILASPHINPKDMGFPAGWEQFPLWQVQTRSA